MNNSKQSNQQSSKSSIGLKAHGVRILALMASLAVVTVIAVFALDGGAEQGYGYEPVGSAYDLYQDYDAHINHDNYIEHDAYSPPHPKRIAALENTSIR